MPNKEIAGKMPALPAFRTFIAIELASELRARIIKHIEHLRRELPDVRASWNREHNLHLTVKFLGDISVTAIPKLSDATECAANTIDSFELIISGCGTFPAHGQPKVLWIGVHAGSADILSASSLHPIPDTQHRSISRQPTPVTQHPNSLISPLTVLHNALEDECFRAGFPREARPFHPHLTIARLRSAKGSRRLAQLHKDLSFEPERFNVSEVVVFRSELLSEGSKHTAISRHNLR